MNYELAKKLKDAGYPQEDMSHTDYLGENFENDPADSIKVPNLSKLIKACGEGFDYLRHKSEYWLAISGGGLEGQGKTPEEAVAELWLALNKPK